MKVTTIDEYIDQFPKDKKHTLIALRDHLHRVVPDACEAIKWGEPAIIDNDGMILVMFAGYKQHINLIVTPSTKQAFADTLSDYKTGKGSIQLSYKKPLPKKLIKNIVAYRVNEYRNHGVTWM